MFSLFRFSEEANSLIAIKYHPDSYFFLKLVAFECAFKTRNYGGDNSEFDHAHAELDRNNDLDEVCPLLEVNFVGDPEVDDGLGGDFRALDVQLIDVLLDVEAQPAEVACCRPVCPVKLKVGVHVPFASAAAKGGSHLHHVHLLVREWSNPHPDWEVRLLWKSVQSRSSSSEEARIYFCIFGCVETLRRRKRQLPFFISIFIVWVNLIGGAKDGSNILIIVGR